MENYLIAAMVLIVIILLNTVGSSTRTKRKIFKNGVYRYASKDSLMTKAEGEFFWLLNRVVQDRYFVFPQVHLSALLDHHVKGQEWNHAFSHINGKSVDFVLCDKTNLRPMYAIELDDPSHDKADRRKRDVEVERIFKEANVPLVRFRNHKNMSETDIVNALAKSHKITS